MSPLHWFASALSLPGLWKALFEKHSHCNAVQPGRVLNSQNTIKHENNCKKWANVLNKLSQFNLPAQHSQIWIGVKHGSTVTV